MTPAPARPFRPRPLDWTKPLRTRDGRKARLLGKLEGITPRPYVVAIIERDGTELGGWYTTDGDWIQRTQSADDLENAPETRTITVYVNVYKELLTAHTDEEEAKQDGYTRSFSPLLTPLLVAHRITAEVEIP